MTVRLLTNRNFLDGKSVEWIEFCNGGFLWKADDHSEPGRVISAAFPVDLQFVKDKFAECGRVFDAGRRPAC